MLQLCAAPFIMLLMDGVVIGDTNCISLNILVFLIGLKFTNKIAYHLSSFLEIRGIKAPEMFFMKMHNVYKCVKLLPHET